MATALAQGVEKINLYPPYPSDDPRLGRAIAVAVGIHFFFAALTCLIFYLLGIFSLRELLEKGGAIAQSGPAPEQQMVVELSLDNIQPPPADYIEFQKQILKPKPVVEVPKPVPPIPKPTPPKPKPAKAVAKSVPKYTAPHATGSGNNNAVSAFAVGTSGLPAPPYPSQALAQHEEGTVRMHVVFDSGGGVSSAEIIGSSGVEILDISSRNFIYGHWRNSTLAGRTVDVPLTYDMSHRQAY